MTRDQIIADLILHGYVAFADMFGWISIWSAERNKGRLAKFFAKGANGPGWDVREFISDLAIANDAREVPWSWLEDGVLAQLTAKELPPKFKHNPQLTKSDPLGQKDVS